MPTKNNLSLMTLAFAAVQALSFTPLVHASCLDESPKFNDAIGEQCEQFMRMASYRGAYSELPYELAADGKYKEHFPPPADPSDLLTFTKEHSGKLNKIFKSEIPVFCAYYFRGQIFNLKDGKERMSYFILKNRSSSFDKILLTQANERKAKLQLRDLVAISEKSTAEALLLGDKIFTDILLPHAGSLAPDYRMEYLRKMNAVLASLNENAEQYQASDCDYLNAPVNHLYGLIQMSRLTSQMVKASCPNEYMKLGLEAHQERLRQMVNYEWSRAVHSAVLE